MKNFYHTRYRFYKPDQKEHTIFAISDIHFSDSTEENLNQIAQKIEHKKPQIITVSGDLIDSLESVDEPHEIARLKAWMTRIAKVAPVCLCLGNHDFYRQKEGFKSGLSKNRGYIAERNDKFIKTIGDIENVHYLDDACFENDEFYVFGLTLPPTYYHFDYVTEKQGGIFRELLSSDASTDFLLQLENSMSQRVLAVLHKNGIYDKKAETELLFTTTGAIAIVRNYYRGEVDLTLTEIRDYLKAKIRWLFK
jgi:predicted phosphodiesterase